MRGDTSSVEDPELFFISGRIFDVDLPKEKKWLLKYFKNTFQRQFLFYFLCYGRHWQFTEHTGIACPRRWLLYQEVKLENLIKMHRAAKTNFEFELLSRIEGGKIKQNTLYKRI